MPSDPLWKHYAVKSAAYGPSETAPNASTVALAYDLRLRNTPFKINVISPGYTATSFNQHNGTSTVEDADGPTGQFFSNDADGAGGELAW